MAVGELADSKLTDTWPEHASVWWPPMGTKQPPVFIRSHGQVNERGRLDNGYSTLSRTGLLERTWAQFKPRSRPSLLLFVHYELELPCASSVCSNFLAGNGTHAPSNGTAPFGRPMERSILSSVFTCIMSEMFSYGLHYTRRTPL